MSYMHRPGSGFRRFDGPAAKAERFSQDFRGLADGTGPGQALACFKRAAPYMAIPSKVAQLVDLLFAWTQPEDWQGGQLPIVWPRNDKLARLLGVQVRQIQNLLDRAVALGLLSHRDSPNGHRGGVRGADGRIKWAYGIVLAPIGTRMEEFAEIADRGARRDQQIDMLKRRLTAARRRISALAQAAEDFDLPSTGADAELALVLSACRQMRNCRDLELLTGCVEQMEARARALEAVVSAALDGIKAPEMHQNQDESAPTDVAEFTHSTTTTELPTAKAVTRSGLAKRSSGLGEGTPPSRTLSDVEEDLEQHGIDPDFIESVTPELCGTLGMNRPTWGALVGLAERLAEQNAIHRHAWHEACRLMGERGAAASVIATIHKYHAGEVRRPGAYLRGMSDKATRGELNLGKTFHGIKDMSATVRMKSLHAGDDPRSMGELVRRAMSRNLVLSGSARGEQR